MACQALTSGLMYSSGGATVLVSPYYDLVLLIAIIMGLYIGIKYAAGKFFTNTGWEAAAMVDMSDLWKSLLAVFLAIGFFEGTRMITCTIAGGEPTMIAMEFLQKTLLKGVLEAINDVFTIQVFYSIYNTFSFRPHEAVWTWTYKIAPGADSIVNITSMLGYGLIAIFGSISAQMVILTFINAVMYQFVLPAGVLLRFFPPTRDAGNFLITLAISFQVVFPMTYVLNKMALDGIWTYTRGIPYTPYIGSMAMGFWKYIFLGSAFPLSALSVAGQETASAIAGIFGLGGLGKIIVTGISITTMEITAYNLMFGLFRPILEAIAELSLVSLFLPALSTTITFASINALTKFAQSKV